MTNRPYEPLTQVRTMNAITRRGLALCRFRLLQDRHRYLEDRDLCRDAFARSGSIGRRRPGTSVGSRGCAAHDPCCAFRHHGVVGFLVWQNNLER